MGMVLKGREEMEAELEDIDSRWGCRDVVIVCMIVLTATRSQIDFSGTLKSLLLKPYYNIFQNFAGRLYRQLLVDEYWHGKTIIPWRSRHSG